MAASFDGDGELSLGQTFSLARHSRANEENHRQRSADADFPGMAQPRIPRSNKSQGALERTVRASCDAQQSSYCPEGARLSLPATLDQNLRTGERRDDAISPGGTVSVPGLADRELCSGASTVSLVLRKDASAGGNGRAHPGTCSNASKNAVAGRPGVGSTAENRGRGIKSDELEYGYRSLY